MELRIPPVAVVLVAAVFMWLIAADMSPLHFSFAGQLGLALAFLIVGIAIALAGVIQFRRAKTTVNPMKPDSSSSLVVDGVYKRTRNPMYLGFVLGLVALAIYLGQLASAVVVPLFVLYMNRFQIEPEERALAARFGEEFNQYRKLVRRWL